MGVGEKMKPVGMVRAFPYLLSLTKNSVGACYHFVGLLMIENNSVPPRMAVLLPFIHSVPDSDLFTLPSM
jgi:hypothetical protein